MEVDFLLIGQGISGSLLAHQLLKRGASVLVLDDRQTGSSRVAAGIWHPLSFRKPGKSWQAEVFIPALEEGYPELEQAWSARFYHPKPYWRFFGSVQEQNNWMARCHDPALAPFMGQRVYKASETGALLNPWGAADVFGAGYVDIPTMLDAARITLDQQGALWEITWEPDKLNRNGDWMEYTGDERVRARQVIFCDGLSALNNPWFAWTPFQPVKGEVLLLRVPDLPGSHILNNGCFICPVGNDHFRVGATYDWRNLNREPTAEARAELLSRFERLVPLPYEVLDHQAGIRPAVKGRKPMIGSHPEEKRVWLFNGMGSKAVQLVPSLSQALADHLMGSGTIPAEVRLERFYPEFKSYFRPQNRPE